MHVLLYPTNVMSQSSRHQRKQRKDTLPTKKPLNPQLVGSRLVPAQLEEFLPFSQGIRDSAEALCWRKVGWQLLPILPSLCSPQYNLSCSSRGSPTIFSAGKGARKNQQKLSPHTIFPNTNGNLLSTSEDPTQFPHNTNKQDSGITPPDKAQDSMERRRDCNK